MKLVFIKYLSLLVSLLILVFGDKSMNMVPIIRNEMRRTLSRHPSRLIGHNFPKTKFGRDWRSFVEAWCNAMNDFVK